MAKVLVGKKIVRAVRRQVMGTLREILADPDSGRALTSRAAVRLQKSSRSAKAGKVTPLQNLIGFYRR